MRVGLRNLQQVLTDINFTWCAFACYSAVTMFAVPLRIDSSDSAHPAFIYQLALGLFVALFTGALLFIGFRICLRASNLFATKLLAITTVGAIRGALLEWLLNELSMSSKLDYVSSIFSSLVYTLIFYTVAFEFCKKLNSRNLAFKNHFDQAAFYRFSQKYPENINFDKATFEQILKTISHSIHSKSDPNDANQYSRGEISKISDEIKSQVNAVIRPLSHRLWLNSHGVIRPRSSLTTFLDAIRNLDYSINFVIGFLLIFNSFGIGLSSGLQSLLFYNYPVLFLSFLLLLFYNSLRERQMVQNTLSHSLFFLVLIIAIPLFVTLIVSSNLSHLLLTSPDWTGTLILAPAISILLILSSLYRLTAKDKELATVVGKTVEQRNKFVFDSNRDGNVDALFSTYLHNVLQSKLLRIAKQLDETENNESRDEIILALTELDALLVQRYSDIIELNQRSLEHIPELVLAWSGLVKISINYDELDPLIAIKGRQVVDAIEEMITNAVRYGLAKEILINVISENSEIEISLSHTGIGEIVIGSGLGGITLSRIKPMELSKGQAGETLVKAFI